LLSEYERHTKISISAIDVVNRASMTVPVTVKHEKWTVAGPFCCNNLRAPFHGSLSLAVSNGAEHDVAAALRNQATLRTTAQFR
jgi:hypothetical protein